MELTKEQLDYIYKQRWDDDKRQEAILRALEYEGEVDHFKTWISTVYHNALQGDRTKTGRREEIVQDNLQTVAGLFDREDVHNPFDEVTAQEMIERVKGMSPLLRYTVERVCMEDVSVKDHAREEGVSENVIYQRIHNAKKELHNGKE